MAQFEVIDWSGAPSRHRLKRPTTFINLRRIDGDKWWCTSCCSAFMATGTPDNCPNGHNSTYEDAMS